MDEVISASGEANLAYDKASLHDCQQLKELETLIIFYDKGIWISSLSFLIEIFESLRNFNPLIISTKSVR